MKKKVLSVLLALVLALSLCLVTAGPVAARGNAVPQGPVEKATGTVSLGPSAVGWHAEFNAHEEKDGRLAKGSMRTWNDAISRELSYDVKYVVVDGDIAWFAALCISDTSTTDNRVDKWLFVKVDDVGTPGTNGNGNGDGIGWDWSSGTSETNAETRVSDRATPAHWWTVIDGNLVVHSY